MATTAFGAVGSATTIYTSAQADAQFATGSEGTFAPTVTLVLGAGNTVPVYSTNTGRYTRVGNRVFVDIYLTGDGGAEGAGTGAFNIALPFTASASNPTSDILVGTGLNSTTSYLLIGQIGGGATTIALRYYVTLILIASMTGADQNNAVRTIRLQFAYDV